MALQTNDSSRCLVSRKRIVPGVCNNLASCERAFSDRNPEHKPCGHLKVNR